MIYSRSSVYDAVLLEESAVSKTRNYTSETTEAGCVCTAKRNQEWKFILRILRHTGRKPGFKLPGRFAA